MVCHLQPDMNKAIIKGPTYADLSSLPRTQIERFEQEREGTLSLMFLLWRSRDTFCSANTFPEECGLTSTFHTVRSNTVDLPGGWRQPERNLEKCFHSSVFMWPDSHSQFSYILTWKMQPSFASLHLTYLDSRCGYLSLPFSHPPEASSPCPLQPTNRASLDVFTCIYSISLSRGVTSKEIKCVWVPEMHKRATVKLSKRFPTPFAKSVHIPGSFFKNALVVKELIFCTYFWIFFPPLLH